MLWAQTSQDLTPDKALRRRPRRTTRVEIVPGSDLLIQNGSGASANAMKPSRLLPHPKPRASYMDRPANGSTAPATDRTTVLAASELAAKTVKASTRYLVEGSELALTSS